MIRTSLDIARFYAHFVGLFVLGKIFFLWVNIGLGDAFSSFLEVFWHGLQLDLSMTSYLLLPLLIFGWISIGSKLRLWKAYIWFFSIVIVIVQMLDPFFYKYWGSKMNWLFVQYIGEPKAAAGSIATSDYLAALAFVVIALLFLVVQMKRWKQFMKSFSWIFLAWLAIAVILVRGGFGIVPINISSAYFSSSAVHNNAAVNACWNLIAYEINRAEQEQIQLIEDQERERLMLDWKERESDAFTVITLNDSSRVLLIVMESLTVKTSALFSGKTLGYTPVLDSIALEGVYFTNAYASSFRSDRGLTGLLTGMPTLADQTITNMPDKLQKLPNLIRIFSSVGYKTSFHYGGDLDFANVRLLAQSAEDIVARDEMRSDVDNVWGVHDEVTFDRFYHYLKGSPRPSFNMLFSLSAHEPFDVPNFKRHDNAYVNSIAYADSCLGVLVDKLKTSGEWENSLLVITADHGTIMPERSVIYKASNYRVPVVLTGGLVDIDTAIHTVVSQFDIPYTLAECLGQQEAFEFSHSLLQPKGIAFYNYYNGLSVVTDSCTQYYDIPMKRYLEAECMPPYEKAFFQTAYNKLFNP